MSTFAGFVLGIVFVLALVYASAIGVKWGKEIAVDSTNGRGYFEAYGKKWRVVEITDPAISEKVPDER